MPENAWKVVSNTPASGPPPGEWDVVSMDPVTAWGRMTKKAKSILSLTPDGEVNTGMLTGGGVAVKTRDSTASATFRPETLRLLQDAAQKGMGVPMADGSVWAWDAKKNKPYAAGSLFNTATVKAIQDAAAKGEGVVMNDGSRWAWDEQKRRPYRLE